MQNIPADLQIPRDEPEESLEGYLHTLSAKMSKSSGLNLLLEFAITKDIEEPPIVDTSESANRVHFLKLKALIDSVDDKEKQRISNSLCKKIKSAIDELKSQAHIQGATEKDHISSNHTSGNNVSSKKTLLPMKKQDVIRFIIAFLVVASIFVAVTTSIYGKTAKSERFFNVNVEFNLGEIFGYALVGLGFVIAASAYSRKIRKEMERRD